MTLTPEREQEIRGWFGDNDDHWPDEFVVECFWHAGRELLAEIDRLRADLATAREALEHAASGFREAYDYGCTWPIGTSDEPQEQRGMARDTFIRNMELLEHEIREALDRIGAE